LLNGAGVLLTAVAMYYIVDTMVSGAREAGGLSNLLEFDVPMFAVSFVLMLVHLLSAAWSWQKVCNVAGASITFRQAFDVHFLAQVGKYVPGKVWSAVGKIGLSRKIGLSGVRTGHALVLESILIVSGCLIVSLPVIPFVAVRMGLGEGVTVALVAVMVLLVMAAAHPAALGVLVKIFSKVTGRNVYVGDADFRNVLGLLPVYVLVLLSQGIAFFFLARSFGVDLPFWPGIFLMPTAVGVGFLALFSPGGLGIREISLVWLLSVVVPEVEPAGISLLAIAARLWITLGEIMAFLAAMASWKGYASGD